MVALAYTVEVLDPESVALYQSEVSPSEASVALVPSVESATVVVSAATVAVSAAATVAVAMAVAMGPATGKVPEASRVVSSKEPVGTTRALEAFLEATPSGTFRATTTSKGTAPAQASLRPTRTAMEPVLVSTRVASLVAPRVTSPASEARATANSMAAESDIRRCEVSRLVVSKS
uniref:Uncharacterized protein n=1 Tax=Rhipicephalus zambeziensis TaxID=60191 RepID=A0A224YA43_9ACAR